MSTSTGYQCPVPGCPEQWWALCRLYASVDNRRHRRHDPGWGADEHSRRATAQTVAMLVRDMRQAETHIVAAMGIDDGSTDFRRVFREMGIEDQWILTPGNDASQIRRAFQVFSQSAVRASQSAAHFGQAVLGGFGAP